MGIYIGLGFFDALSILVLMFSLYRLPVGEYKRHILIMAIIIAVISYIMRIVIGAPKLDPLIQIGLFLIFLRYFIKIKIKYAALIPTSAFAAYILIQAIIFAFLIKAQIINEGDVAKTEGIGTYLIQILTISAIYIISFLMNYFRFGFSFISSPPHNFSMKDRHPFRAIWPAITMSLVGVAISINALMELNILLIVLLGFIMFSLLYYLSHRREKQDRDRIYRSTYFRKDK